MNHTKYFLAAGALMPLLFTSPVIAQSSSAATLEEIIVTGRHREESLQEVPIAASVLSASLLNDAGIVNLYDLFDMVPGLKYDEQIDRLGAQPSVRGVQSNEIASNRVKVSAFIDGMPVLGSQGSIGFNSFQQVEVYRGPQSAAFGRSTFAGAINYITNDPGDEFEANIAIDANDFGKRVVQGAFGGPITDSLGYLIQLQKEDSDAPSEWAATGQAAQDIATNTNIGQSDGTQYGNLSGENMSAKLVFEPSDSFRTALTFSHVETHDGRNPELYLTDAARQACFNGMGIRATVGMTSTWIAGEMDCDWSDYRTNFANHDDEAYLLANPLLLNLLVTNAQMAGAAPMVVNGATLSVQEQILMVARAYSIPEDARGSQSERDRFTLKSELVLDSGHSIDFSYMHNEETQNRINDVSVYYYDPDNVGVATAPLSDGMVNTMAPGVNIQWNPMGLAPFTANHWAYVPGGGAPRVIGAAPAEIEEDYAELRWVSPGEDRLRYVVGASFYDYSFLEQAYGLGGMGVNGVGYGAYLNGIVPEFEQLTGLIFAPDNYINSENATNTAAFFNVGYDITDKLTVSAEGRFQTDKVGGKNNTTGLTAEVTTKSFLPRVALTYNLSDETTAYLQWSQGVNPAGINVGTLNPNIITSITNGVANALIPYNAALDVDLHTNGTTNGIPDGVIDSYDLISGYGLPGTTYKVDFDAETFQSYKEEKLTNIEFGLKGNLLDGKLTYAAAVYHIDWKDQLQTGAIQWDSPCSNNGLVGDPGIAPCVYNGANYFWIADSANTSVNGIGLNYGDVKIDGIEFEGTYRLSQNWNIRGTASYLDAKYDSYCDIALYDLGLHAIPSYAADLNIEVLQPSDSSTISSPCYVADGREVARQPALTGSLSPTYSRDVAGLRFSARLDLRYEGQSWLQSGNYSKYSAVTTQNVSFTLGGDAWSATIYVNNVTDENSPRSVSSGGDDTDIFGLVNNLATGTDYLGATVPLSRDNFRFSPRLPRTVGLRASYNF